MCVCAYIYIHTYIHRERESEIATHSILKLDVTRTRSDRVPDELWMEVRDIVRETGIKANPMENEMQKKKPKQNS